MIKPETVHTIMNTARIEEVVGEFVSLKKRGANLIGLCPFHNEKTPSFVVSPSKGIFKCFGCGKAGNSVHFIMEHEHYSFSDALKFLAAKYNIPIDETERTPEEILLEDTKDRLFNINSFAQKYFTNNLLNTQAGKSIGITYFKKRGFTDSTIDTFQLGYCFDKFDAFLNYARENGYKDEILAKSGLSVVHDDGKMFDRFKSRIIFPIHNLTGRIIGFGGRIMTSDKSIAKYINSPESEIYHKSDTLYGIYFSKNAIISKDFCYLVEGYVDFITMYQAGFTNVVASSGTSLTVNQIRLIKRFTKNITIIYDGDAAGIKASLRGTDMVLAEGMNVRIILLPEPEDPDSFINNNRTSDVIDYFRKNTFDFIKFKTDLLLKDVSNDPIKKAEVIMDIVNSIAVIPDEIYRSVYIKECANMLDVKEQTIIFEINKIIAKNIHKQYDRIDNKTINQLQNEIREQEKEEESKEIENPFDFYEMSIIEKLILYGDNMCNFNVFKNNPENNKEKDDNNEKEINKHYNNISVAEYIINELDIEEMNFVNPLTKKILNIYRQNIANGTVPEQKYFINNIDKDISQAAANIVSTRYILSDKWKEYNVYIKTETDDLVDTIIKTLLNFKAAWVRKIRADIQEQMKNETDEQTIIKLINDDRLYKHIEIAIDKELNRVIT